MLTKEIKNKIQTILESFIIQMNQWERRCNEISKDTSLSFEKQFESQKRLLLDIFEHYCTNKDRKNGKPNTISYGEEDSYDYDPNEEIVVDVIPDEKNASKVFVHTFREEPLDEKFQYIFIFKEERWLIDSKKVFDENNNKWKNISL